MADNSEFWPAVLGIGLVVLICGGVGGIFWYAAAQNSTASPAYVQAAVNRVSAVPQAFRTSAIKEFRQCLKSEVYRERGAADYADVEHCVRRARSAAGELEQESIAGVNR